MKKLYLFAAFIVLTVVTFAAPISQKKASSIAANFFGVSQQSMAHAKAKANANAKAYYIFNNTNGKGYVIVSGDDRMPSQIIGYSRNDNWPDDENAIPPVLRTTLEAYAKMVQAVQNGEMSPYVSVIKKEAKDSIVVNPLIKTQWGQAHPYNDETPLMPHPEEDIYTSFGHYYVGCATTALGQILNYWRHVDSPARRTSFYTIVDDATHIADTFNVELEYDKQFDWDNMPLNITYYPREGEDSAVWAKQGKAVAQLLKNVAYSLNMSWSKSMGGSSNPLAVPMAAMLDYGFTYNATQKLYTGEGQLKAEEAIKLIKADLDNARPVFVGGSTSTGGGHAFIFDGYDNKNYVHVNWGWEGMADGWFDASVLLTPMGAYNLNNSILTNLHPRKSDETLSVENAKIEGAIISDSRHPAADAFTYYPINILMQFELKGFSYLKNAGFDFDFLIKEEYKDGEKNVADYDTIAVSSSTIDHRNVLGYITNNAKSDVKNVDGMHNFSCGVRARLGDKIGDWVMSENSVPVLVKSNHFIINPDVYNTYYHAPSNYCYFKGTGDDYSFLSMHLDYVQNPKNLDVNDTLAAKINLMYKFMKWFKVLNEKGDQMIRMIITKDKYTINVKDEDFSKIKDALEILQIQKDGESSAMDLNEKIKFPSAGTYKLYLTLPAMNLEITDEIIVTGTPTGIETSLTPTLSSREGVYNLQGQQVNNNYKGVVIKNGRKILMK